MNFNELSWAALCFYYRSGGDKRYARLMRDAQFISKLRQAPSEVSPKEFEEKVLLDHVNIQNYDLLIGHRLAENVLAKIVELQPEISSLQDITLIDLDLQDKAVTEKIKRIYASLYSVPGLWLTGVSKIAHLLNDKLLAILNLDISDYFGLLEDNTNLLTWIKLVQQNAREVTKDFHKQGFSGLPEKFLSQKLGYADDGYEKSLVKFLDEYFWLRFGDGLPIPPRWVPPLPQLSELKMGKQRSD
jgi:hypothetical protein